MSTLSTSPRDGSHIYIKGRVVSSDESGNIYKSVIISDGTASLTLAINATKLYQTYQFGQELVIDLTGMSSAAITRSDAARQRGAHTTALPPRPSWSRVKLPRMC